MKPPIWHHYTPMRGRKERALCGNKWATHWVSDFKMVTCKNCLRLTPPNVVCFITFKQRREFKKAQGETK